MVTEYKHYECDICGKSYAEFNKALDCELRGFIEPRIEPGSVFLGKFRIFGHEDCETVLFLDGCGKTVHEIKSHYPIFKVHKWPTQLKNGRCTLADRPMVSYTSLDEPDFLHEFDYEQFELVKAELKKKYAFVPSNSVEIAVEIVRGERAWFLSEIQRLRNAIEHAVKVEDYERAALLRGRLEEQLLRR